MIGPPAMDRASLHTARTARSSSAETTLMSAPAVPPRPRLARPVVIWGFSTVRYRGKARARCAPIAGRKNGATAVAGRCGETVAGVLVLHCDGDGIHFNRRGAKN